MIFSVVADPLCFGPASVSSELIKRDILDFLEATVFNGVLLDTDREDFLRDAIKQANSLSQGLGQRIVGVLTTMLTNKHKYIASVQASVSRTNGTISDMAIMEVALNGKADAVLTERNFASSAGHARLLTVQKIERIRPVEFQDSQLRKYHKSIQSPTVFFDALSADKQEDAIGRILKYAREICVLDPFFAADDSRVGAFFEGLNYIVAAWNKCYVNFGGHARVLEIYTLGDKRSPYGFIRASDAKRRLSNGVAACFGSMSSLTVISYVKKDNERPIFHARYLCAKARAFSIDPGFDGFNSRGATRRLKINLETAAANHISECKGLTSL